MAKTYNGAVHLLTLALFAVLASASTALAQTGEVDNPEVVIRMADQEPMRFIPNKVTIKVGQSVEWVNDARPGGTLHNVTTDPNKVMDSRHVSSPRTAGVFDSGNIKPGKSFVYKFTVPGVYDYACSPHEGSMRGEITVEP